MQWLSRVWTFGLLLVVLVFGVSVAVANRDAVPLNIPLFWNQSTPAWIAYGLFFLLGAVVGAVWFGGDHVRKMLTIRRLRRRLRELDPEHERGERATARRRDRDEPHIDDALSAHP
jgi:uncharacterized integral membrane protein